MFATVLKPRLHTRVIEFKCKTSAAVNCFENQTRTNVETLFELDAACAVLATPLLKMPPTGD